MVIFLSSFLVLFFHFRETQTFMVADVQMASVLNMGWQKIQKRGGKRYKIEGGGRMDGKCTTTKYICLKIAFE